MTPADQAKADLIAAEGSLEDAAYHLATSGRHDAALLAEHVDRLVTEVAALASALTERRA